MGKVLGKATSICGGVDFCLNYKIRITALLKMDTITDTFLGIWQKLFGKFGKKFKAV